MIFFPAECILQPVSPPRQMEERPVVTRTQAEIFWSTLFFLPTGKPRDFVQPAFENTVQAEAGYEPK